MDKRYDKPQGRFVRLYESPDEFDVLSYLGATDKWLLWVDMMPHKKFSTFVCETVFTSARAESCLQSNVGTTRRQDGVVYLH